jgi:protein SCO1/2
MPTPATLPLAGERAGARPARRASRRRLAGGVALALGLFLAGCGDPAKLDLINVAGSLPPLSFAMTRAEDGKPVSEASYRGKIVLLYFGYSECPDECPTTLANLSAVLARLGGEARDIRVLFVTVDPDRDTAPALARYVANFASQIEALRGTPDELARLARRYRVVYSVRPASAGQPYEVTHSAGVWVFDGSGAARLLFASLDTGKPDLSGAAAQLKRLAEGGDPPGLAARLAGLL